MKIEPLQSSDGASPVSRRQVLCVAAAAWPLAALGHLRGESEPAVRTDPAAGAAESSGEPVVTPPFAANPLSLAAYSFHRYLPRGWPRPQSTPAEMTLENFIDLASGLPLDAVELTSYYFPNPLTIAEVHALRDRCERAGLAISGTAIGNDFCKPAGPDRDFELLVARQWVDYAAALGAGVIRVFAGHVPEGDTHSAALARCVEGLTETLDYAAGKGVRLAIENHGGITATAGQLLEIIDRVNRPEELGINFDSGNFRTADPYADLEQIAPYAFNAQLKLSIHPDGKTEPADLPRVLRILENASYRGAIVLEYEEAADPRTEVPLAIDRLRKLIGPPA